MSHTIKVRLEPLDQSFEVQPGTPLRNLLQPHGFEFPCGGRGVCKKCRVRVIEGDLPIADEAAYPLAAAEIAAGWRLACLHDITEEVVLAVAATTSPILTDETRFEFTPDHGRGIAVDIGSTTLACQLLDLEDARVVGVRTALNPQARHGADIMSRIGYCVEHGIDEMRDLVRAEVGRLIGELLRAHPDPDLPLRKITLVGNTPMHNIFCGIDVTPLSHYPFEPRELGLIELSAAELGWDLPDDPRIEFLPGLGSFVGSDITAGVLATRMHHRPGLHALIDLGTNGEIVVTDGDRILCASTAAGPAFEAANVGMGMRAAEGAIAEVWVEDGGLQTRVLGGVAPRGICGSGLVDAVAAGLELGIIQPSGRIDRKPPLMPLVDGVAIGQEDVRELQLAKGAIAVGLRLLLKRLGHGIEDLDELYLAGAFGNYIRVEAGIRIGLFQVPRPKIRPSGNTALLGAKLALFDEEQRRADYAAIAARTEHVGLHNDMEFHEAFVDEMVFP